MSDDERENYEKGVRSGWMELFGYRWDGDIYTGAAILWDKIARGEIVPAKRSSAKVETLKQQAESRMAAKWVDGKMVEET